jgi:CBS domain containing-hemolysin-like protein
MMSAPVHFVSENTPLRRAIFLMLQLKISCLLISDASDNAVGIITTDDLLWHLSHLLADEEDEHSRVSYQTQQTIGEVAKELAQMGI